MMNFPSPEGFQEISRLTGSCNQKYSGSSYRHKLSNLPIYEPFTRKEFLRGIAVLHIGEWKSRYENPCVLDGIQ